MTLRLMTEQHLEFLCLKGGFKVSSASTLVEMAHCWKLHILAMLQLHRSFVKLILVK